MALDQKKYKIFTKQIYNHIIDDQGENYLFNPSKIHKEITDDEFLQILTQRVTNTDKIRLSFMVYLYDLEGGIDQSVNDVLNQFTLIESMIFSELGSRYFTCPECQGNGAFDCNECDTNGESTCDLCDGSGEDETGDPCYGCNGDGGVTCGNCSGSGLENCNECGGSGEVESEDSFWEKKLLITYTLNDELRNLKLGTSLSSEESDEIESPPSINQIKILDSDVPYNDPFQEYDIDEKNPDSIWVVISVR